MNYRNILGKVICWTGGRGSGKTFSLAFECLRDMINGLTCWSNVPVIADIEVSPDDIRHYETLPLDIDSLRVFDKDMSNGTIAIDEINLWADSLSTLAVGNKLISAVFQLLTRKRGLAFRLTVQNFKWLTNRIRWQTDLVIACSDMCYLYHELEPGECISQSIVDMSGVFSGHPFEDREDNTQNYRQQIFHCKPFRGIYDTN